MTLAAYALRRVVAIVATIALLSLLVFGLLALAPGDPATILLGPQSATPEAIASINERYGLDDPFLVQYGNWVVAAVQGDFGVSIRSSEPVMSVIGSRMWTTIWLALYAFIITVLLAIPVGILAAVRRGSWIDRVASSITLIALCTPAFAIGFLLIYVFSVQLDWFPGFGNGDNFLDTLWHLTLPALALASLQIPILLRQTRAAVMDIVDRDYIVFARSRGLSNSRIWLRYVLRNGSLPVLTSAGLILAFSLAGAVLIENVFALQGLGSLLVSSVGTLDLPVVQALTLLTAILVLITNLVVDLLYFALDPRLRRAGAAA
ncbi:MAG: ABC transporter permease [Actinomycetales bacterium]